MRLAKGSFGSRAALTAALLAVGCFTFAAASVAQAKNKDKEHKVHGHVISVTAGATSGTYTLTIDVHHHKKGVDAGTQVSEHAHLRLPPRRKSSEKSRTAPWSRRRWPT